MRLMNKLFFVLGAVSLAGCASGTIKRQQAELASCEARSKALLSQFKESEATVSSLNAQIKELKGQISDLEGKLHAEQDRSESLAKSNKELASTMEGELSGKVKEIVAEKDDLSRRLDALQKEKISADRLQAKRERALAELKPKYEALSAAAAAQAAAQAKAKNNQDQAEAKAHEDMGTVADGLLEELKAGTAKVDQDADAVTVILQQSLLFKPQQAKLTDAGVATLDRLGRVLQALGPRAIRIEGHSDNASISWELFGGFASHWELSAAQAAAVAHYLHEHAGIDPRHLSPVGLGEFRPLKGNDTPEGRQANRRIVLIIHPAS